MIISWNGGETGGPSRYQENVIGRWPILPGGNNTKKVTRPIEDR